MNTRIEHPTETQGQIACASCGRVADGPPLTWSRQVGRRGSTTTDWLCDVCTRENLREIEGKLDELWW